MSKALDTFFHKNEKDKVVQEIAKNTELQTKYDTVKDNPAYKLAELEERVSTKTQQNFEERFEAFKKAVLEAEKQNLVEMAQSKVDETIDKAEEVIDDTITKATDGAINWVEEKVPGAKGFISLFKKLGTIWDKTTEIYSSKGLMAAISVFLGLFTGKIALDSFNKKDKPADTTNTAETNTERKTEDTPATDDASSLSVDDPIEDTTLSEAKEIVVDDKKKGHFSIGKHIIKIMGGRKFETEDNSHNTFDAIKEIPYSELEAIDISHFGNTKKFDEKNLEKLKRSILGSQMEIVYENILGPEQIKQLRSKDSNSKLFDSLGIYENTNWKDLSIETLAIASSIATTGLIILSSMGALYGLKDESATMFSKLMNFRIEDNGIQKSISEEVENFEHDVMSKELIAKIMTTEAFKDGTNKNYSFEEVVKEFGNFYDESKHYDHIKKLLEFRDFTVDNILNSENDKYNHGEDINKNINLKHILGLYLIFNGEKPSSGDINNSFYSSLITPWIITTYPNGESATYQLKVLEYINRDGQNEEEQKESELLKVLTKTFIDKTFLENFLNGVNFTKDGVVQFSKEHPEKAGLVALIILIFARPVKNALGIGRTILAIGGISALIYGYTQLDTGEIKSNLKNFLIDRGVPTTVLDEATQAKDNSVEFNYNHSKAQREKVEELTITTLQVENLGEVIIKDNSIFLNHGGKEYQLKAHNYINDGVNLISDITGIENTYTTDILNIDNASFGKDKNTGKSILIINDIFYITLDGLSSLRIPEGNIKTIPKEFIEGDRVESSGDHLESITNSGFEFIEK